MELLDKPHCTNKNHERYFAHFPTLLLSNENCDANANAMQVAGLGRRKPISFSKNQTPNYKDMEAEKRVT